MCKHSAAVPDKRYDGSRDSTWSKSCWPPRSWRWGPGSPRPYRKSQPNSNLAQRTSCTYSLPRASPSWTYKPLWSGTPRCSRCCARSQRSRSSPAAGCLCTGTRELGRSSFWPGLPKRRALWKCGWSCCLRRCAQPPGMTRIWDLPCCSCCCYLARYLSYVHLDAI